MRGNGMTTLREPHHTQPHAGAVILGSPRKRWRSGPSALCTCARRPGIQRKTRIAKYFEPSALLTLDPQTAMRLKGRTRFEDDVLNDLLALFTAPPNIPSR
jgi:hypothetical protein